MKYTSEGQMYRKTSEPFVWKKHGGRIALRCETARKGNGTIKGFNELLTIIVNDVKGKDGKQAFTARIDSKTFTSDITGTFSLAQIQPAPPGQNFVVSFDAQVGSGAAPEPATLMPLGAGIIFLLGYGLCRRRRTASAADSSAHQLSWVS